MFFDKDNNTHSHKTHQHFRTHMLTNTHTVRKIHLNSCPRHTVPKLSPDGHSIKDIFEFGSDQKDIGPFMRASSVIVWPPVDLFRLLQQPLERGAKSLACPIIARRPCKGFFHVEFVCQFFSSSGHRDGILSNRVIFVFTSSDLRCNRVFLYLTTTLRR